jgi:hypothetical protein
VRPVSQKLSLLPYLARRNPGLRQEAGAQQLGQNPRVQPVVFDPGAGNGSGLVRMHQVQLQTQGLDQVQKVVPVESRFHSYRRRLRHLPEIAQQTFPFCA